MSLISENFSENFYELSLEEKIETILSMLNTPIFRRKIGDNDLSSAISKVYYEYLLRISKEKIQNDKA